MATLTDRIPGPKTAWSLKHLGDGDPSITRLHDLVPEDSSDEEIIQLVIPEVDHPGEEETFRSYQAEQNSVISSGRESRFTSREDNTEEQSSPVTSRPKSGNSFVTSKHFLREKIPKSAKGFRRSKHSVHHNRIHSAPVRKCTNVTAVLNKPIVSPGVVGPLFRVDSGYSSPPTYSGNSIRKVGKEKETAKMSYIGGELFSTTHMNTNSSSTHVTRIHEKEELQRLNDRFSSYVQRVRQLREYGNQFDSSAFFKSTKQLEEEVASLKTLYERELTNIRIQLEEVTKEKNLYHLQCNKHTQTATELQDRLSVEIDKNRKLIDEVNACQRRISNMEAEIQELRMSSSKPHEEVAHLQRDMDNLLRDNENLKRRCEKEQLIRQEAEEKSSQLTKTLEFNEQVHIQECNELRERLNKSSATVVSMEARIREINKTDNSIPEMLKSVRDTAEEELKQYKMESEQTYTRNLTSLQSQMEGDAKTIERINAEKSELLGSIGELKSRITSLEGQIQMLQHQKRSGEEMLLQERRRSAEQIQMMEKKFREVQDLLFVKIREANTSRDSIIPLKAEIEAMKVLLEEEERRLKDQTCFTSTTQSMNLHTTTTPVAFNTTSYVTPSAPPLPTSSPPVPLPVSTSVNMTMDYPMPQQSMYTDSMMLQHDQAEPFPTDITSARYTYETTPNLNRLQIDPSPPITPRPVGPVVRVKSAPASGHGTQGRISTAPLVPTSLGYGKDYFDEMFNDLKRETLYTPVRPKSSPTERYATSTFHDYTTSTSRSNSTEVTVYENPYIDRVFYDFSAIGEIKILEVNQDGKFVRLVNESNQDSEFGGYMVQQNVGGNPVAVYRFPPRAKFPANSTITVWSGTNDPMLHQPPSDFVWKEQMKWGTGPECTTILCKPNGQAIAWTTAAHRFSKNVFEENQQSEVDATEEKANDCEGNVEEESLTEMTVNINGHKTDPVYLRREKQAPATLSPQKHPHGTSPGREVHPHSGQARPMTYGNDNSSVNRQSRSQTTRPDPIPGQPYAGAAAQKMGSAPLRKFSPTQFSRGNTNMSKQSENEKTSPPPNSFMTPHKRFDTGLRQIQSQHNPDFLPPMPRPPLFSSW